MASGKCSWINQSRINWGILTLFRRVEEIPSVPKGVMIKKYSKKNPKALKGKPKTFLETRFKYSHQLRLALDLIA
jgi:hypothetical protein